MEEVARCRPARALKLLAERLAGRIRGEPRRDRASETAEELGRRGYVLRHGGLSRLLEEDRAR